MKDNWDRINIIISALGSIATVGMLVIAYISIPQIQKGVTGIEEKLTNFTTGPPCGGDPYPVAGNITYDNKPISTLVGIENVRTYEKDFLVSNEFGNYIFALGNLPSCFKDKDTIKISACFNQTCRNKMAYVDKKTYAIENLDMDINDNMLEKILSP